MTGVAAWHERAVEPGPVPLEPRAALSGMQAPDLLVIGMGASGLAAAATAAERGAQVVAVDAAGVAAGAAGANGGFLLAGLARFHHEAVAALGRRRAVAWYRRTLDELDRIEDVEPTFRRVGSLRTAADGAEAADLLDHLAALRRDGLPGAALEGAAGPVLLVPGDGAVDPVARCRRLAHAAVVAGARLVAPARVTRVASGEVVVADGAATLRPRAVLVAVDGGLEVVLPGLAGRVRTARLQMQATAPDTAVTIDRPTYHRRGLDYVQQLPSGVVLLGGGRDLDVDAWTAGAVPSSAVQDHLDGWRAALGGTAPVTHRWAAHAALTEDRLPVDERVAPGVHAVGAYSGHGNVLGPLLARAAAVSLLDDAAT